MIQSSLSEHRVTLEIECDEYVTADRYSQMAHLVHQHDIDEQALIQEGLHDEDLLRLHQTVIALKAMGPALKRFQESIRRFRQGFRFANLPLVDIGTPIYDQLVLEDAERQLSELKAITDAEVAEAEALYEADRAAKDATIKQLNKKNRIALVTWIKANASNDLATEEVKESWPRNDLLILAFVILDNKYPHLKEGI